MKTETEAITRLRVQFEDDDEPLRITRGGELRRTTYVMTVGEVVAEYPLWRDDLRQPQRLASAELHGRVYQVLKSGQESFKGTGTWVMSRGSGFPGELERRLADVRESLGLA